MQDEVDRNPHRLRLNVIRGRNHALGLFDHVAALLLREVLSESRMREICMSGSMRTTYCVCLELRSLPSTGITRLHWYYEPLRHPWAPGLSLAGVRLVVADRAYPPGRLRAA